MYIASYDKHRQTYLALRRVVLIQLASQTSLAEFEILPSMWLLTQN